jgi:hypothetical protein
MDWPTIIVHLSGLSIVFFYALSRFNTPPPLLPAASEDNPKLATTIRQWFQMREPSAPLVYPPPRANTTAFKFWLYRNIYAFIGVGIYLLASQVPGVRAPIPQLIALFGHDQLPELDLTNGLVLAVLLVALSRMPPLSRADAALRRLLYERASIPAKQLEFQRSLYGADYHPEARLLQKVRKALAADGFDLADIVYDPEATTRSLWTKTSLLIEQLQAWSTDDHYTTALAILREPGSEKLTADRVREAHEALKGDARTCLSALRNAPGAEETQLREARFRQECKMLLDAIYCLLARIALRSYYSFNDATAAVRGAGFHIQTSTAPLPNKNDLVALVLLLFLVTTIPLGYRVGFGRAAMVTLVYLLAILTPIYLAAEWPNLLRRAPGKLPPIAFPLLTGLVAAALGFVVTVVGNSLLLPKALCGQTPALLCSLNRWISHTHPWTVLILCFSAALSVLMMVGRYPGEKELQGVGRYRQWASVSDALLLAGLVLGLMALYVLPRLTQLNPGQFDWTTLIRPVMTAFFIGLVVPTWYRGNARQINDDWQHRHAGDPGSDQAVQPVSGGFGRL